jgi:site-specific recombinase XerD
MGKESNKFGNALKSYLINYLPLVKGYCSNTVKSYRDTFKLFIEYFNDICPNTEIEIEIITNDLIIGFLIYLESVRKNSIKTRNLRLAAIHSFFTYLSIKFPEYYINTQKILSVKFKRAPNKNINYFEKEEMEAIFESIDIQKSNGKRDYLLLSIMFNTGGRVQEILNISPCCIHLEKPSYIQIYGKGRKDRMCPIWPQTRKLIEDYFTKNNIEKSSKNPLFTNNSGLQLTRSGVNYMLKKYFTKAINKCPTLKYKKMHPHCIRHTTAMFLLKSGIDIVTISHFLGHESIETTNIYLVSDLTTKINAINILNMKIRKNKYKIEKTSELLTWLKTIDQI